MAFKVIILPLAKQNLKRYIRYTAIVLQNKQAATSIRDDARDTKKQLSKIADILPLCPDPVLAKLGYRKISFRKHDFFMIYRIDGNTVVVESMYHTLQDYESIFLEHINQKNEKDFQA